MTNNLESNIISNLGTIFPTTSSYNSFINPINNINSYDFITPYKKITAQSTNGDGSTTSPDLPPIYNGPNIDDFSPLTSAYDYVFDNVKNLALFIRSNMPFQQVIDPIIEGIGGFLYTVFFQYLTTDLGINLDVFWQILAMAILDTLINFIGPKADEIGGKFGDTARQPKFSLGEGDTITKGQFELLLDGLNLCLASLETKISDEVTLTLTREGNSDLANKLSY